MMKIKKKKLAQATKLNANLIPKSKFIIVYLNTKVKQKSSNFEFRNLNFFENILIKN